MSKLFRQLGRSANRLFKPAVQDTVRFFKALPAEANQVARDVQRDARRVGNQIERLGDKVQSVKAPGIIGGGAQVIGSAISGIGAGSKLVGSRNAKEALMNTGKLLNEAKDVGMGGTKIVGQVGTAYATGNPVPLFL
jgi:hypothetical protein